MNTWKQLLAPSLTAALVAQFGGVPSDLLGYKTQDSLEVVGRYYIHGATDQASGAPTLWINYIATLSGPREQPLASEMLEVDAGFAVTASAPLDVDHIAVGGQQTSASGTLNIVEIWTLRRPSVDVVVDPVTFERKHALDVGAVTSRVRVLEQAATPGRTGVRRLVRVRGKPAAVFCQFHDSGDLYEIDYSIASPTLTRRFSPAANTGVPQVPDLNAARFKWLDGRRHATEGCMYVFYEPVAPGNGSRSPFCLTLIDSDCDGNIDTWRHMELAELSELYDSGYKEIGLATRW